MDLYTIADILGVKQGSVSLALNDKNERTFLRIVALLEKELGNMPADIFDDPKTVSQGLQEELAALRKEI